MKVKKVSRKRYVGKVHNIGVSNHPNYFANQILVHNCYQDSSAHGKDADYYELHRLLESLAAMKVFELAIGGGEPTLYPSFPKLLEHCRELGIVPNFTTKNTQWLRNPSLARRIMDACGTFGVSVEDATKVRELRTLLDYNGFEDAHPNIHVVLGVVSDWDLREILRATNDCRFDTTLLSYKSTGRGKDFKPQDFRRWLEHVKEAMNHRHYQARIGIDTPLAAEFEEGLINQNVPKQCYETKEGGFSCYIDAVEMKIGVSSYSKEEMVSIAPPKHGEEDHRTQYQKIIDAFASF